MNLDFSVHEEDSQKLINLQNTGITRVARARHRAHRVVERCARQEIAPQDITLLLCIFSTDQSVDNIVDFVARVFHDVCGDRRKCWSVSRKSWIVARQIKSSTRKETTQIASETVGPRLACLAAAPMSSFGCCHVHVHFRVLLHKLSPCQHSQPHLIRLALRCFGNFDFLKFFCSRQSHLVPKTPSRLAQPDIAYSSTSAQGTISGLGAKSNEEQQASPFSSGPSTSTQTNTKAPLGFVLWTRVSNLLNPRQPLQRVAP